MVPAPLTRVLRLGLVLIVLGCAASACGGHGTHKLARSGRLNPTAPATARPACPVTLPRPWTPPPGVPPQALFGAGSAYGNGRLWVGGLWPGGVIAAGPAFLEDAQVSMKFGWWRATRGHLRITGRRLDAPSAPLRAQIPDYGLTGFQASGVTFPSEGCWQITGTAGPATLTFVTLVTKA